MVKYSFLIPAYNRVKETEAAINSILKQKINDYEIIVLDDKSTEDFTSLIEKYEEKVKFLKHSVNEGLSKSRNDLIKESSGEYFVLLDNDDVLDDKFLETVDSYLKEKVDILSFTNDEVKENKVVKEFHKIPFELSKGIDIMINWILSGISFDSACFYVYNREFFQKNCFKYEEGRNHEDFGLTPIVISKANKMISIDKVLYHVSLSEKSILREKDNEKNIKNIYDKLYHYDNLMKYFKDDKVSESVKKIIYSFLSNVMISNINNLPKEEKNKFINELKKRNIYSGLLDDNIKRRIKKFFIKIKYRF